MKHRLNLDIKDPNYTLLKEIFKIMECKETYRILSSFGFKNLDKLVFTFTSSVRETAVQKTFFRKFTEEGINVSIESNGVYYE